MADQSNQLNDCVDNFCTESFALVWSWLVQSVRPQKNNGFMTNEQDNIKGVAGRGM